MPLADGFERYSTKIYGVTVDIPSVRSMADLGYEWQIFNSHLQDSIDQPTNNEAQN